MTTVHQALIECMRQIGAVRKSERNTFAKFTFRGIDAVVNAVSPAFREHGVFCVPEVLECERTVEQSGKGKTMRFTRLRVRYTFYGPEGDSVSTVVASEAYDTEDKATSKAMSVAMRQALLQTLCLPTDELDPDAYTPPTSQPTTSERADAQVIKQIDATMSAAGFSDAMRRQATQWASGQRTTRLDALTPTEAAKLLEFAQQKAQNGGATTPQKGTAPNEPEDETLI